MPLDMMKLTLESSFDACSLLLLSSVGGAWSWLACWAGTFGGRCLLRTWK